MRQALAAPERNTMFNKKDKDPIEPLEGEEVKKKGFPAFGRKKEKDPAAKIVTPEKRRRQLSWLCGACAAVAVGSLAFAAVEFTVAQDTVAKSQADMIEIVVPKETIKAGTPITADMLEEAQVPKRYVPPMRPMGRASPILSARLPSATCRPACRSPWAPCRVRPTRRPSRSRSLPAMSREPSRSMLPPACRRCSSRVTMSP